MVILTLGDFTFTDCEIPEKINIGGEQRVVVHDAVGGGRVVDSLGPVPDPTSWSGLLLGQNALDRAKYLDYLRRQGKPLALKWSALSFMVIIRKFQYDFIREYRISYSITCEIIYDVSAEVTKVVPVSVLGSLQQDMDTAYDAADNLGDFPNIPTKVSSLGASLAAIKSAATATQAQIKDAKNKIQDLQGEVTRSIASVNNTLQYVTTLGGVLPRNPLSTNAAQLTNVAKACNNNVQLMNLKYTVGRMGKNISTLKGI